MNWLWRVIKLSWQALNFIRDLVMNFVFLFFVLLIALIVGLVADGKKSLPLNGDQGALLINLNGYLADNREQNLTLEQGLRELNGERVSHQISTFDVVYAIDMAARDNKIQGLVLDLKYLDGADLPSLQYVGKAIERFKQENKPVIAIADYYDQKQYLLASFADEIYLSPMGDVALAGFSQENLYFKDLLDKLKVTPHIFRVGTYKSAVEPFLRNDMSSEAKANMQQWLGTMWQNYLNLVGENRKLSTKQILPNGDTYLAELKALKGDSTAYALQRQLVTSISTRLETKQQLINHFGENSAGDPKLLAFNDYLASLPDRMETDSPNKIAIVIVEGTIIDGESDEAAVGGDTVATLLRQAYEDPKIKGVILRVNSPGGSAFASEIIRQEVENLQSAGKPVVVSMGGMAASGGYWISANADYIVADKNTITGSIGIFSLFATFENTLKQIGVNADGVKTTELTASSVLSPLSDNLNDIYQLEVEQGYDKFLTLVSQGRHLSKQEVDNIAQGKVWLGSDALKYQLVDELGDFDTAFNKALELVKQKTGESAIGVKWLVKEDQSLFAQLWRDLKQTSQFELTKILGQASQLKQLQNQINQLNRLNDPKGQYLYCLTCTTL